MKKIGKWAQKNPVKARIIIGVSHVLVIINAIIIGILLYLNDWGTSIWPSVICANLICVSYFFYPSKHKGKKAWITSFYRRKAQDFSFVVLHAVVIAFGLSNFLAHDSQDYRVDQQSTVVFASERTVVESKREIRKEKKAGVQAGIKQAKKNIRAKLRALKAEKSPQNKGERAALKTILILLTIVGAIALGFVISVLACTIGCAGGEALATTIIVLGWAGVVWMGVIAIRQIMRM